MYLSLFIEGKEGSNLPAVTKVSRGLTAGMYATLGFVLVFGALGILTETGLSGAADDSAQWAHYPMVLLGVLLVLYGIAIIAGKSFNLHLPSVRPGLAQRRPLVIGLFGISYAVASLGCSLPLFLGGVASGFSHRGLVHGAETFIAYAVGMGLLLTIVALVMSLTGVATARKFRVLSPLVRPLGGVILVLVGAYLATYWIAEIVSPTSSTPVSRFVDSVQGNVSTYLQAHASMLGEVLGVILIAGTLILLLLSNPFGHRRETSKQS